MRKLTLKEMQAVCRGTAAPAGAGCGPYGCQPPVPPKPPKPKPCKPNPSQGVYC